MKLYKKKKIFCLILATSFFLASGVFLVPRAVLASENLSKEANDIFKFSLGGNFFDDAFSFVKILLENFSHETAFAISPDPDTCGMEEYVDPLSGPSVPPRACINGAPSPVTIAWSGAQDYAYLYDEQTENNCLTYFNRYDITISGLGIFSVWGTSFPYGNLGASYTISSDRLAKNTTYNWSVVAYYNECRSGIYYGGPPVPFPKPEGSVWNDWMGNPAYVSAWPHGSFTTSNCAVAGVCGAALNTCASGTFSDTADSECKYNWDCLGSGGGANASCSLNKADGTACSSDSNSCTNDICSSGTCSHPAVSGSHLECQSNLCASVPNNASVCTNQSSCANAGQSCGLPVQCAISASPNPCSLSSPGGNCNSTISWNSANGNVKVEYGRQGGSRSLVWDANSGSNSVNWIDATGYNFYCVNKADNSILAQVYVNGDYPACNCSSWSNIGCGQGGCPSNNMYQTRTCNPPASCSGVSQTQCVYDAGCASAVTPTYIIDPSSSTKQIGQTQQFNGWYDSDGPSGLNSEQNVTVSAYWSSSDSSIASVNSGGSGSGLSTCKKSGSVTISSVYGGITATANLQCVTSYVCQVVSGLQPSGTISNASVNLTWNHVPGSAYYFVRLDDGVNNPIYDDTRFPGRCNPHYYCEDWIPASNYCSGNTCTITNIPVTLGRTYSYWVHAYVGSMCNPPGWASFTVVSPKPHIVLNPASFTFNGISGGATPSGKPMTIQNSGTAALNWTASGVPGKPATWCSVSPASGSIGAGASQNVTVNVTAPSNIGSFADCGIRISDPNADNNPQDAAITYIVTAGACPAGTVKLSSNSIYIGQTSTASAPTGFSGGSFQSSASTIASVSGSTITGGPNTGTATISGSGWSYINGATNCLLSGISLTVNSLPTYTLTVNKTGTGSGTVIPSTGILSWTGNTGTASYISGTSVTLIPSATGFSSFGGWGTTCVSAGGTVSGNQCLNIPMTQSRSLTAIFTSGSGFFNWKEINPWQ